MAYGVDDPYNTASMPTPSAAVSSGWFQPGNPGTNLPATTITVDWLNGITAEIVNTVTAAGLTPSKTTLTQLSAAIVALTKLQGTYLYYCPTVAVAAASTSIIGPSGVSAVDTGANWILPFNCNIVGLNLTTSVAPGAGFTATSTIWKNGIASTPVAAVSGASQTVAAWSGTVACNAGDKLSVHTVLSASAATMYVRGWIFIQPT